LSHEYKALKRDNRYQRDKKRKLCKRRAAIEPIIGHLKSDFRLSRNLLKGQVGDEIRFLSHEYFYHDWLHQQ
jgi:IS5 family transposase